ncbi:MAG: spinster family MFS transporter [Hyphomonadaceae bacterium]
MTEPSSPSIGGAAHTPPGNPYLVLALLLLVYIFNIADRVLLGVMAGPIKLELGLSDTELGILGGTAFALFYATLGVLIAWIADRRSRSWIVTVSLTLWSAFTAACGLATNFLQLFAARLLVGVGEAGGVAPSYSLISDYFPPSQRARALAVYSFGIPMGSAIGLSLGGVIATNVDWRTAFIYMGVAGMLTAPLFKAVVRDPVRGGYETRQPAERPHLREALRTLRRKPSFWLLALGSSLGATASYGVTFWIPTFYVRSFGVPLSHAAMMYAAIILVAGVIGAWAGAWMTDRFGPARPVSYVAIPVAALLLSLPFYLGAVSVESALLSAALLTAPTALGAMCYGPILAAVQNVSPPAMRTTASAMFLLVNNLIGLGFGSAVLGFISDALQQRYGDESLRQALLAGSLFYLGAAMIWALAALHARRDWEVR